MSKSSPSPQPEQQEQTNHEPDVVSEASLSLNQETLNQPDPPPPKSDPPPPPLDPEYNSPDEEDDDDDEDGVEIVEGQEQETPAISSDASLNMVPPITVHHVSDRDVTIPSPSPRPKHQTERRKLSTELCLPEAPLECARRARAKVIWFVYFYLLESLYMKELPGVVLREDQGPISVAPPMNYGRGGGGRRY